MWSSFNFFYILSIVTVAQGYILSLEYFGFLIWKTIYSIHDDFKLYKVVIQSTTVVIVKIRVELYITECFEHLVDNIHLQTYQG